MLSSISAARAMASKWRTWTLVSPANDSSNRLFLTAFVDPPKTLTITIALRKELRVRMSLVT